MGKLKAWYINCSVVIFFFFKAFQETFFLRREFLSLLTNKEIV